jgi:hypothetical protein
VEESAMPVSLPVARPARPAHLLLPFPLLLLISLALAACGAQPGVAHAAAAPPRATAAPSAPTFDKTYIIDRFTFTTPAQMCSALLVADATVESVGPSRWNTSDGQWSPSLQIGISAILTPVRFTHMHILLDHRRQPTAGFVMYGGTVGHARISVMGFAQPQPGARYLIAFAPSTTANEAELVPFDAFPISAADVITLQAHTAEPGAGALPDVTIALSALAARLATCP